ncbi:fatty acid desaturase [Oligoflexus tunisiensis]|uniref:fatty acid desaturase n=1 Tax=Oligoflexus tunisiensis TaxID=708132 RepID=UPI00159F1BF8|nr:fatty acid desaturase [Oligoflexus tunisiensis]
MKTKAPVMQLSLSGIMRTIPRRLFVKSRLRSYASILKTLTFLVGGYGFVLFCSQQESWIKWPLGLAFSWWFLGTALTGAFDLAHDAAHRSLFPGIRENNIWGHFLSSLVGWPFHLWRLSHNIHHTHTNNAKKDIAWEPYTEARLQRLPPWIRWQYTIIRSRIVVLWVGGFLHLLEQFFMFRKGKRFRPEDRSSIWLSTLITGIIFGAFMGFSLHLGPYVFCMGFVVPLVRYYWWLSVFTLLHHTHPERPFLRDDAWNAGVAQLLGTINVRYGWYVDWLTHNIAWHIPHHVTVAIPHYHLKEATRALRKAYPGLLHEERYSLSYLLHVLKNCQQVESMENLSWKPFSRQPKLARQTVPRTY